MIRKFPKECVQNNICLAYHKFSNRILFVHRIVYHRIFAVGTLIVRSQKKMLSERDGLALRNLIQHVSVERTIETY